MPFIFGHLTYVGIMFAAGYWQQVEEYVSEHTEADFTFGICGNCLEKLYPEFIGDPGKDGREYWNKNNKK